MPILTRAQVRNLDRIAVERFEIPSIVLMENAGRGATDMFLRLFPEAGSGNSILILAGRGNNGGDAFVVARRLALAGLPVEIHLLGHAAAFRRPGDAGTNFAIVERLGLPVSPLQAATDLAGPLTRASAVVDGILGTGLEGQVRGLARDTILAVNEARTPTFALDTPSGLDCDTGLPLGVAVRARATATFAAMKTGLANPSARPYTGTVEVVDIGAPVIWE
jgi:hydroxyethylthiazole kinase-like uncharacterized protein yjeF